MSRFSPSLGTNSEEFRVRGLILAGVAVMIVFFGAFGGWSALAPLASAARGRCRRSSIGRSGSPTIATNDEFAPFSRRRRTR